MKFPDQGTTIAAAIEQGTGLFKAFDFLDASGNLMLLFSDGQDTQVTIHGRHVSEIVAGAVQAKIPVYMIRTSYNKALGGVLPDDIWKPAIEATGGKFYAAGDEATILNAIKEIDRRSAGRVDVRLYSTPEAEVRRLRLHRGELLDRRADAAADGAVFSEVSVNATFDRGVLPRRTQRSQRCLRLCLGDLGDLGGSEHLRSAGFRPAA